MSKARRVHTVTKSVRAKTLGERIGPDLEALDADMEHLPEANRKLALERARQAEAEGYLSARQIAKSTGYSKTQIGTRLRQLQCENRLLFRAIHETTMANTVSWKTAYHILPRKGRDKRVIAGVGPLGGLNAFQVTSNPGGKIPYGFDKVPGGRRQNPVEQAVVRFMVKWRGLGWGHQKIAARRNAKGILTRYEMFWTREGVRSILERFLGGQSREKKEGKPRRRRGATS